jgi:hypothetical protein
METQAFLETVHKNIKNVVKVKLFYNTTSPRWLTWRFIRDTIYMYDCGENYASVRSLADMDEFFKELRFYTTNSITSATIKYEDDSKDTYHFK